MIKRLLILTILMAVGFGTWLRRPGPVRAVLAALLVCIVLGVVIGWLAKQSTRLSGSGRDPRDIGDAYGIDRQDRP